MTKQELLDMMWKLIDEILQHDDNTPDKLDKAYEKALKTLRDENQNATNP